MQSTNKSIQMVSSTLKTSKKEEEPQFSDSDFREDTGAPVSIFEFNRSYLKRNLGPAQIECYKALWGEAGNEWDKTYKEIVLLIGMKGGKNYWCEGDLAYVCYFISSLKNPHDYFTKLCGKPKEFGYSREKTFDMAGERPSIDSTSGFCISSRNWRA